VTSAPLTANAPGATAQSEAEYGEPTRDTADPDDLPILNGVLAAAVCRVERTIRIADHVLVLGLPGWCGGPPQTRDRPALIRFAGTSQPLPGSALASRVAVRRNVKDA